MVKHTKKGIEQLIRVVEKEEDHKGIIPFDEFLDITSDQPEIVFRNIFQHFYDMTHHFLEADSTIEQEKVIASSSMDSVLAKNLDSPFFSDRFFSHRLLKLIDSFRGGVEQNKIYVFEGPPGCGKSVFLNNFLNQFETYSKLPEGAMYETVWKLDMKKLGGDVKKLDEEIESSNELLVPCPNHDHPIIQVPKLYRKDFIKNIVPDSKLKEKILSDKQYEWIFENDPCTVCSSLSDVLMEKTDFSELLKSLYVRRYNFKRNVGEGISIFNPSDKVLKNDLMSNKYIKKSLETLFKDSNKVPFFYSHFAKTNNGVYAVMDVKEHNVERFRGLHGIVSDKIHKVEHIEENVQSLFFVVINPEDRKSFEDMHSFKDRITTVPCKYVLDYETEIDIYEEKFGDIEQHFLPGVLDVFSKLIVASRIENDTGLLASYIESSSLYYDYCDEELMILKMELYANNIPEWLSDDDKKKFLKKNFKSNGVNNSSESFDLPTTVMELLFEESEELREGEGGISGRKSIALFQEFLQNNMSQGKLIDIIDVGTFFHQDVNETNYDLLSQIIRIYDHRVLNELKTSLYHYDEDNITRDIQNYLFAVDQEPNEKVKCIYTNDTILTSDEFFERIEKRLLGNTWSIGLGKRYRREIVKKELLNELIDVVHGSGADIKDTKIFKRVFRSYTSNLKENVLDPFVGNDNFGYAIKSHGTDKFNTYSEGMQRDVNFLLSNLEKDFGYSNESAQQIAIYAVDYLIRD